MNIEQLNLQFSNEAICRDFFEAARWPNGRICPHCSIFRTRLILAALSRIDTNASDAKDNLPSPPRRPFTAPSCRFANGYWPCI